MVLDSSNMPEGFTLFYEVYIPGDRVSADLTGGQITPEEVAGSGLQWYYESVYLSGDGNTRLRSYVEQYADADGATRGFALLEDETRLAPEGSVFTDSPGAGVGEEPSEISEGSLQPSGTSPVMNSIDSTFRTGNLLAGVSVDTLPETPAGQAARHRPQWRPFRPYPDRPCRSTNTAHRLRAPGPARHPWPRLPGP